MSRVPHIDMGSGIYSYIAIAMSKSLEMKLAGNPQNIPINA